MTALHTGLVLPRMPQVPAEFTFRRDARSPKLARLARILLDLGVLIDDDAHALETEAVMVENALRRWTAQATGELAVFGDVYLIVNPDTVAEAIEAYSYTGDEPPDVDPNESVLLSLLPWDAFGVWLLEVHCTEIERRVPGLAQTAIHLLDRGLWRSVIGITPRCAYDIANELLYGWCDGDNEGDNNGALTQAEFEAGIPKWVRAPKQKLGKSALQRLAHHEPVAQAALDLLTAVNDKQALQPQVASAWHASYSVVLRWSENDAIARIVDDHVNDVQNGGECTDDYAWQFITLEHDEVEQSLDALRRMLRILACTDRLISLIAEPPRVKMRV